MLTVTVRALASRTTHWDDIDSVTETRIVHDGRVFGALDSSFDAISSKSSNANLNLQLSGTYEDEDTRSKQIQLRTRMYCRLCEETWDNSVYKWEFCTALHAIIRWGLV